MNWNAFKRLFHYLGRYKLRLILVMIAAVLSTLFTVLTPAVTGGITSELYDGVASGSFDWETIVWLLVTLIALYLVAQLFAILQSFSMTKLTACVMETLRGDIDRKMHHLKLDYYDSHTQGEILSTITNDVDTVNNALSQNLTQIVTQVVTAVGILVMMFTTSPILTAIAVAMVPVSLLASLGVMKTGAIHYARQQELLGQLNGYIEEVYQGQELVSVFNYRGQRKSDVLYYMLNKRMGAEIDYVIRGVDPETGMAGGSRMEAMALKRKAYFYKTDRNGNYQLYVGSRAEARVVSVIRAGIFVDLFGAECYIPLKELSYQRWVDASQHFQPGQRVLVRIIELDRSDWNHLHVTVSVKQASANPYEKALKRYVVGERYVGTVSLVDLTGVFVSLDGGVDCLCTYPPRGRPPRGARVTVRILGVNTEKCRIWGTITHMSTTR